MARYLRQTRGCFFLAGSRASHGGPELVGETRDLETVAIAIEAAETATSWQVGKGIDMVTLNDALMALVTKKLVAPDEAYGKSIDKNGMEVLLKRTGWSPAAPAQPAPSAQPAVARS